MEFNSAKIKIHFYGEKFSNKGNKVVCVLNYFITAPEYYDKNGSYGSFKFGNGSEAMKAIGVAVCGRDDIFDIEKGKKIAKARAETEAYKRATELIRDKVFNLAHAYANMYTDFYTKNMNVRKHNKEYIKKLTE